MLDSILFLFSPPIYSTSCAFINIVATGVGVVGDRRLAFDHMFKLTYVDGLPFPPPADCIATGDPTFYAAIYDYIDEYGSSVVPCKCDQLRQPGQQGGVWPVCWP